MAEAKLYRINHANTPWQVSACLPGGARHRKHFKNKGRATAYRETLNRQFKMEGPEGVHFGTEARAEYAIAKRRLAAVGASLGEAVQFYLDRHTAAAAMPFQDALNALLTAKAAANRREVTISGLRTRLTTFADHGSIRTLADIDTASIIRFISRPGLAPRSRLGYRGAISTICRFARQRGWMKADPLESIEVPTLDAVPVKIFTPEQVARLMDAAAKWRKGFCVRALALRLFAGLRPTEVDKLAETDIRATVIKVTAGKRRGRRAVRNVPISPVLRAWLDRYPAAPLAFTPTAWQYNVSRNIIKMAGLGRVPRDIYRKTWISYRMAEVKHEGQVAREAGNSPNVIFEFYFDAVEDEDVPRFLSVFPR